MQQYLRASRSRANSSPSRESWEPLLWTLDRSKSNRFLIALSVATAWAGSASFSLFELGQDQGCWRVCGVTCCATEGLGAHGNNCHFQFFVAHTADMDPPVHDLSIENNPNAKREVFFICLLKSLRVLIRKFGFHSLDVTCVWRGRSISGWWDSALDPRAIICLTITLALAHCSYLAHIDHYAGPFTGWRSMRNRLGIF